MAEAFDVADRGRFYDRTGAIKDVVQNHMLQVLATVMADPPEGRRTGLLADLEDPPDGRGRTADARQHRRGQYDGYLDVAGVAELAHGELRRGSPGVDSWRWAGVPISSGRGSRCRSPRPR